MKILQSLWFALLYTVFNVVLFGAIWVGFDVIINYLNTFTGWEAFSMGLLSFAWVIGGLYILYLVGNGLRNSAWESKKDGDK